MRCSKLRPAALFCRPDSDARSRRMVNASNHSAVGSLGFLSMNVSARFDGTMSQLSMLIKTNFHVNLDALNISELLAENAGDIISILCQWYDLFKTTRYISSWSLRLLLALQMVAKDLVKAKESYSNFKIYFVKLEDVLRKWHVKLKVVFYRYSVSAWINESNDMAEMKNARKDIHKALNSCVMSMVQDWNAQQKFAYFHAIRHPQLKEFWFRYFYDTECAKIDVFIANLEKWVLTEIAPGNKKMKEVFQDATLKRRIVDKLDIAPPFGDIDCIELSRAFSPEDEPIEELILSLCDEKNILAGMQLPALHAHFGGRYQDVLTINYNLKTEWRIQVIHANNGMGKSAVANAAARKLHSIYGGHAFWCHVGECKTVLEVLEAMVVSFGEIDQNAPADVNTFFEVMKIQARIYARSGLSFVMVLDEMDHVIDEDELIILRALQQAVSESRGRMRFIVTTISLSGLNGNQLYCAPVLELDPLKPDSCMALLEDEPISIQQKRLICERTGGVPQSLHVLTKMCSADRARLLEETIEFDTSPLFWIKKVIPTLPQPQVHVLRALSVTVVGLFDFQAAYAVVGCNSKENLSRVLEVLVNQSLLESIISGRVTDGKERSKFRVHENVRDAFASLPDSSFDDVTCKRDYVVHFGRRLAILENMLVNSTGNTAIGIFDKERYVFDRVFVLMSQIRDKDDCWEGIEQLEWIVGVDTLLSQRLDKLERLHIFEIAVVVVNSLVLQITILTDESRRILLLKENVLERVAYLRRETGRHDDSLDAYEEALNIRRERLGGDHPEVLDAREEISWLRSLKQPNFLPEQFAVEKMNIQLQEMLLTLTVTVVESFDFSAACCLVGMFFHEEGSEFKSADDVFRTLRELVDRSLVQETGTGADVKFRIVTTTQAATRLMKIRQGDFDHILAKRRYILHYGNKLGALAQQVSGIKARDAAIAEFDRDRATYDRLFSLVGEVRDERGWKVEHLDWMPRVDRLLGNRLGTRARINFYERNALGIANELIRLNKESIESGYEESGYACTSADATLRRTKVENCSEQTALYVLKEDICRCIAHINMMAGDNERALKYYGFVSDSRKKRLKKNDLLIASAMIDVGIIKSKMGEDDTALRTFEDALEIKKTHVDEHDPSLKATLNNIATVYLKKMMYDKALKVYNEVLKIDNEHKGEDALQHARTLKNIGTLHEKTDKFEDALSNFFEARDILEADLGNEHLSVASILQSVANVYRKRSKSPYEEAEDYEQAIKCYEEALNIRKKRLGENHESVISIIRDIKRIKRQHQHRLEKL